MTDIYGTLADSKTYHAERGNTAWAAGADADLTIALLRGAEYVDNAYATQFPGYKTGYRDQVREWPRTDAADRDGNAIATDEIPDEVINATYEAALRELATPGSLRPDFVSSQQVKSVRVEGAVSREFFAGDTGIDGFRTMVPIIGGILAPILRRTGGSSRVTAEAYRV